MERSYNDLIREARIQQGLSQKQLAEKLNIPTNTVSRWERGEHYPQPYWRQKLCDALGKTREELGLDTEIDPQGWETVMLSSTEKHEEIAHALECYLKKRRIRIYTCSQEADREKGNGQATLHEMFHHSQALIVLASPSTSTSKQVEEDLENAEKSGLPVIVCWVKGQLWTDVLPSGQNVVRAIDAIDVRNMIDQEDLTLALDQLMEKLRPFLSLSFKATHNAQRPSTTSNPYKGLDSFEAEDAKDFFGRDHLVSAFIDKLADILSSQEGKSPKARLLAVVGPSGSGKSSLVKAGILPRLQQPLDELPGSHNWLYLTIRPASHPLQELKQAIKEKLSLPDSYGETQVETLLDLLLQQANECQKRVMLVVDQFEEVFASTLEEQERQQFIDLLIYACTQPGGPLLIILTLRTGTLYGPILFYPGIGLIIDQQHDPIRPMERHELRAAITRPVIQPGGQITFADDLIEDLLYDVNGQSGALPLLQFTLEQLYTQCIHQGNQNITREAYQAIKGIKGALNNHAEQIYQALSKSEQETCKALFLRLITPGITPEESTRHRIMRSELHEGMYDIVKIFTDARLLTTHGGRTTEIIEISHEALVTAWEKLRGWTREALKDFPLRESLYWNTKAWLQADESPDYLYYGNRLKEVQALQRQQLLSPGENALVRASTDQENRRRVQRKKQGIARIGISLIIIIILVSAGIWAMNKDQAGTLVLVTNTTSHGPNSFSAALQSVRNGGTIEIDSSKVHLLYLTGGDFNIQKDMTIRVIGNSPVILSSRASGNRIHIHKDVTVDIAGLIFSGSRFDQIHMRDGSFIVNEGSLQLLNCKIQGNEAISGGGILNRGDLSIIHSTITGNIADDLGGGIDNEGGTLHIQDSEISYNHARNGGGIYNQNAAHFTLVNATLNNNQALGGNGGAIASQESNGTIKNSILSDNITKNPTGRSNFGAAIYDQNGKLSLTDCKLLYNTAQGDGGGIALLGSEAEVTNCEIRGNSTAQNGGAFADEVNHDNGHNSQLSVINSKIFDNKAQHYGATLWVENPSTQIGLPTGAVNSGSQSTDPSQHIITEAELDQYCKNGDYQGVHLDDSSVAAYGWACVSFDQNHFSLSMTNVCQWLYPHQAVIDRITNINDPYSWQCWRPL